MYELLAAMKFNTERRFKIDFLIKKFLQKPSSDFDFTQNIESQELNNDFLTDTIKYQEHLLCRQASIEDVSKYS